MDELLVAGERAAGVEFTSVQLASIDRVDYLSLHPESRVRAFFMTPAIRKGIVNGRAALHPLDYTGIARHLAEADPFDSVIAQFTPPDENGWCSPGLSADFTPLVWAQARRKIGHLNPNLPRIRSGFRVHVSEFDVALEASAPLLSVKPPASNSVTQRIGRNAAQLIRDHDTLQFGLGSVISEVANALHSHRGLRIHSGMIAAFVEEMWESGCIDKDVDVVTGVVFGEPAFYERLESHIRVRLEDVRYTHSVHVLKKINRFVAVNSAVEVDLFGQVNSERSDGLIQAGAGGLPAFAQAAQVSQEARLVVCLPATARKGSVSRIIPSLGAHGLCTVPRYLADAIVTEYGIAELRGRSMTERAEALIAIAHPDYRDQLANCWKANCLKY
ncbi:acetyl-CoA hydrolase [Alcaligenaceae bacterium]|nr:acetyl-CoA hydrolase [Alcaligenaceae bacterium]